MMWYCTDCDDYFDEPREVIECHSELGKEDVFPDKYFVCPTCGGEYIEEAKTCKRCGEPYHDDGEFCPDCIDAIRASFADWLDNEAWEITGDTADAKDAIKNVLEGVL